MFQSMLKLLTRIISKTARYITGKGLKILGNFVDFDITHRGKHWAYRGTVSCSYNVKNCPASILVYYLDFFQELTFD